VNSVEQRPILRVQEYSTFGRRFAAWLLDAPLRFAIGLACVYLPMRFLVLDQAKRYGSKDANYLWSVMPSFQKMMVVAMWLVAAVIAPWLYTAIQECSSARATLGKRLVGIQVTDLEGKPVSFARASGRFFGRLIPTLGIGYCTILFTQRKQALHDLISRCVVIRDDEGRRARE
jgi:uncharacterized RDD family membrane protein YckC